MTFTESTRCQLFDKANKSVIRMSQKRHAPLTSTATATSPTTLGTWTIIEHELFLEGLTLYPSGPWKCVAQHIGSRTPRQVMTHAQKYRQRLQRRAAMPVKPVEAPKQLQSDRVLSIAVSPMPMQPAASTGEIHVEAAMFMAEPPYSVFGLDELLGQLASDPIFDHFDMCLPYADVEPLQL